MSFSVAWKSKIHAVAQRSINKILIILFNNRWNGYMKSIASHINISEMELCWILNTAADDNDKMIKYAFWMTGSSRTSRTDQVTGHNIKPQRINIYIYPSFTFSHIPFCVSVFFFVTAFNIIVLVSSLFRWCMRLSVCDRVIAAQLNIPFFFSFCSF